MSRSGLKRGLWLWWLPVTLGLLWWFGSAGSGSFFFPPLERILAVTLRDLASGLLLDHLRYSLVNMVAGLAAAAVIGIGAGLVIGESRALREATAPFLNFLRAIPPAAIVPIIIVAMGIGPEPKIFLVAFACVWPILLNTVDGVRGINPQMIEMARAFRIPFALRNRRILVMGALPQIMAGLRTALAVSLVLMVISEFVGASAGLGFYIRANKEAFAMAEAWGGTLLAGLLGYGMSALFLRLERRALHWHVQTPDPTKTAS